MLRECRYCGLRASRLGAKLSRRGSFEAPFETQGSQGRRELQRDTGTGRDRLTGRAPALVGLLLRFDYAGGDVERVLQNMQG